MNLLWCNGEWREAGDFPISPADRGLLLGLGLFETLLGLDGEPVFAGRHLERLRAGCVRLGWQPELPDLPELMRELLWRNDLTRGRARIRLTLTGGSGRLDDLALGADHKVWLAAVPAGAVSLATTANLSPWVRNERSPMAGMKGASYGENLLALAHARSLGFDETVFLNTQGWLCEAATANLFFVTRGELRTPSLASGCLPGVTRQVVLELASQLGISCHEGSWTPAELETADEVVFTSAIRGPIEVSRFETRSFQPGPVSRALRQAWDESTRRKI